jgi:DNA-binding response OmpR family regulator
MSKPSALLQNSSLALVISRHPGNYRIVDALQDSGFTTVETSEIKDCLSYLENPDLSLVIVLQETKGRDDVDLLAELRNISNAPIVMAGSGRPYGLVRGLVFGADIYLDREVSTIELQSRIRALLRRFELTKKQRNERQSSVY